MEQSESEEKPKKGRKKKEPSERKPNWKEYMATVEDIQNFLMDRILLRHNVITRRVEFRLPSSDYFSTTPSYRHPSFQKEGNGTDWQPPDFVNAPPSLIPPPVLIGRTGA